MATAASTASFPQPITGLAAALIVLAIVIFVLPPSSRLWVALFVLVMAIYWKGKQGASIIDTLTQKVYGGT